ncbi:MAG: low molecular weight phosphotyrosine protein phosphatase [Phycisphaera sp.]|nr:MAG: low molecular weight phosphotyrosine protein phosphatase [Phycisphaera sp.]
MSKPETQPLILFVCLGNICRSPLAEGIFLHMAKERGLDALVVDSCGTGGWHEGEGPDRRAMAVAKQRGVHLPSRARQVRGESDFTRFTHIIAMDASNVENLLAMGAPKERVRLMCSYDPAHAGKDAPDVPDPYYGGDDGFDKVFDMLVAACEGLLDEIEGKARA